MQRHPARRPVAGLALLATTAALLAGPATTAGATAADNEPDPATCQEPVVALVNGGFELPDGAERGYNAGPGRQIRADATFGWYSSVPGWATTARDRTIELIGPGNTTGGTEVTAADGGQFTELNARDVATLYQDADTTPGSTLYWRASHRGVDGADTAAAWAGTTTQLVKQAEFTDGPGAWVAHGGRYVVPDGQTRTRFALQSVSSASTHPVRNGNLVDDAFVGSAPCLVVTDVQPEATAAEVGDFVRVGFHVASRGGDRAGDTTVTVPVPAGGSFTPESLEILGATATPLRATDRAGDDAAEYDPDAGQVVFHLGDLPAGGDRQVWFTLRIDPAAAGQTVSGSAGATYRNLSVPDEPPLTATSDHFDLAVPAAEDRPADLTVTKTASPGPHLPGRDVTFTVTVTNNGPSRASGVEVVDVMPSAIDLARADTPACTRSTPPDSTLVCPIGLLGPGASKTYAFAAPVAADATAGTELVNAVLVHGDQVDPDPANNAVELRLVTGEVTDIGLATTAAPDAPAVAGLPATWTVAVTNNGPGTATGVTVTDTLPAELFDPAVDAPAGWECSLAAAIATCATEALPAGSSAALTMRGTVDPATPDGATLTNVAELSATGFDPNPDDNRVESAVTVARRADLALRATSPSRPVRVGNLAGHTLRLSNNGPSLAANVAVDVPLPAGLTIVTALPSDGEFDPATSTWSVGELNPGDEVSLVVRSVVGEDAAGRTTESTATATAAETDPDPGDNSATLTITGRAAATATATARTAA